ncbi:MAG TPA: DUF1801 domain-containing protein [Bacteroidota bacterium]|nr:DUF1801 domain-containing protein [Bacteroidota bacterium]
MEKETPENVDEYLSSLSGEARKTLSKLRATIRSAAPGATEGISYQIPTFFYYGGLVAYAAFKNHCSFFPMSSSLLEKFKKDIAKFDTSKGTIRFPVDKPLPASLVIKIVKDRVKQNKLKQAIREKRRTK